MTQSTYYVPDPLDCFKHVLVYKLIYLIHFIIVVVINFDIMTPYVAQDQPKEGEEREGEGETAHPTPTWGTGPHLTISMITSWFFLATCAWEKMQSSTWLMSGLNCSLRLMTHLS